MRYLSDETVRGLNLSWPEIVATLADATSALRAGDYAQPVKPYLHYGDPRNRIIAMPAYIGRPNPMAGLKWIASFPGNLDRGIQRAHAVTILNEPDTGVPVGIIASGHVSALRTAGVTALLMEHALPMKRGPLKFGMTGFGPIGQTHLEMLFALYGARIGEVCVYDPRGVNMGAVPESARARVTAVDSWQQAYGEADVFITCTVSSERYVDRAPPPGSLQLNVSLRDYQPSIMKYVKFMVVDDWDEVCRKNTDIELMHKECGLQASDTVSLADVCAGALKARREDDVVMFSPMGMAVFDVALGALCVRSAKSQGLGVNLDGK